MGLSLSKMGCLPVTSIGTDEPQTNAQLKIELADEFIVDMKKQLALLEEAKMEIIQHQNQNPGPKSSQKVVASLLQDSQSLFNNFKKTMEIGSLASPKPSHNFPSMMNEEKLAIGVLPDTSALDTFSVRISHEELPLPVYNDFKIPVHYMPIQTMLKSKLGLKPSSWHNLLIPHDKYDMAESLGKCVQFELIDDIFKTAGTGAWLSILEKWLRDEGYLSTTGVKLFSSPLRDVTLPEPSRIAAHIPMSAAFYAFLFSPVTSIKARERVQFQLKEDRDDPFVSMLLHGAFVYFSHDYELVAVNAIGMDVLDPNRLDGSLFLPKHSFEIPLFSEEALRRLKRFRPLKVKSLVQAGYTEFTWVTTSEILGDYIYTRSGGFVFSKGPGQSRFLPVVPKMVCASGVIGPGWQPRLVDDSVDIPELGARAIRAARVGMETKYNLMEMSFASSEQSTRGILELLGMSEEDIFLMGHTGRGWVEAIESEFTALGEEHQQHKDNLRYLLYEKAKEEVVVGNDGNEVMRETGNSGMTLDDFCCREQAKIARLGRHEVLALRIYTSSTFRMINNPLRSRANQTPTEWAQNPVPLPATTYCIYTGLKKLRAVNFSSGLFESGMFLWRGMQNLALSKEFQKEGGSELACVSTSKNLEVVARYASSDCPLIFKFKVSSPMDLGADISWLSIYPGEQEILYPPLTHLHAERSQGLLNTMGGRLLTVKATFPS